MPRSLAEARKRFVILTTEPANPEAPTETELAAGLYASPNILTSDFTWGATDSDTVQEKPLNVSNNASTPTNSNYTAGVTPFRYFDETGAAATSEGDEVYQALKVKGTLAWGYCRFTSKHADDPMVAADEIYLGAKFITDTPQPPSEQGGYIKYRVPLLIQEGWDNITVAPGAGV